MSQAAGGTSIVQKTVEGIKPPSINTLCILDLVGYDGFPALTTLEEPGLGIQEVHV